MTDRTASLRKRYPTIEDLRRAARRRVPRFGFDYVDGGAGLDLGVARNGAALDAIELVPRYGIDGDDIATEVTLFGRRYALPIGIAPMGLPGLLWPGAEEHLARAAQAARIPYTAGTVGGVAVERLGKLAPDVLWFQLYRLPADDHKVGFDLIRRAYDSGAHVLVLTLDVPTRVKRRRELLNGLVIPFRPSWRTYAGAALSPAWLMAMAKYGQPYFANFTPYAGTNPTPATIAAFGQREIRSAFSWDEVSRYRERWKGKLVVKGVLHPLDAEKAVSAGVDGIQVSNHGGRQLEGAPAAIDVLPAIAAQVGMRATLLMDSGIRSGLDVVRAITLGAASTLAGRAFLYALGAIGAEGAEYAISLLTEELRASLRQLGCRSLAEARSVVRRHPGAVQFDCGAAQS